MFLILVFIFICTSIFFSSALIFNNVGYNDFFSDIESGNVVKANISFTKVDYYLKNGKNLTFWIGRDPVIYKKIFQKLELSKTQFTTKVSFNLWNLLFVFLLLLLILTFILFQIRSISSFQDQYYNKEIQDNYNISEELIDLFNKESLDQSIINVSNTNKDYTLKNIILNKDNEKAIKAFITQNSPDKFPLINNFAKLIQKNIQSEFATGVLLYGPPGTGKTSIARAIAGELNSKFINVSASSFDQIYVGAGSKLLEKIYFEANEYSLVNNKPVVIFIDEIDAFARKRSHDFFSQHTQTLLALLEKMQGFNSNPNIKWICATNDPESLDEALISRFAVRLEIALPNFQSREKLFRFYAAKALKNGGYDNLLNKINFKKLAEISARSVDNVETILSGRDISQILGEQLYQIALENNNLNDHKIFNAEIEKLVFKQLDSNEKLLKKLKSSVFIGPHCA